jgi:hypothetical protein
LLIAVLGRLSRADAIALTNLRRDGRLCRAIVLHPAEDDADDPAQILVANGWRVARSASAMTISDAWTAVEWGVR